ncbi:MAG: PHP domain-containing protein [Kiritimatiellae bacterium]|nr:PHP domain-containing protein [Kiritimatiellia bacterium]
MIDLHVHSTASDGTVSPAELARRGNGFSVMAITDHDNCDGVEEFLSASSELTGDPAARKIRLAGIELSVEPGAGYDKFHLLGLGLDPSDEGVKGFLKKVLDGRNGRNRKIISRFASIGIMIPEAEIATYAHGEVLARPHFANWLVDHGYSTDVRSAFKDYLTPSSPPGTCCYVTRYHPDPAEAFNVIHAAGGVAVMAHPKYWTKDSRMLRDGLAKLKEIGLDGIEAVYQANEPEETIDHLRAAKELGLCVTAGSDFHGSNKPAISLGMDVDDEQDFLAPFFECLAKRRGDADNWIKS